MGKMFAVGTIPPSILVTALALANLVDCYFPGAVHWAAPFSGALQLYAWLDQNVLAPGAALGAHAANISLPQWVPDALIAYGASATAFGTARGNFSADLQEGRSFGHSIVSAGWPFALLAFVLHTFFSLGLNRFTREHTTLFLTHSIAVASVIATAAFGNDIPLPSVN